MQWVPRGDPFRANCSPVWGLTTQIPSSLGTNHSNFKQFGGRPLKFQAVCPENGTAVLKGACQEKRGQIDCTGLHQSCVFPTLDKAEPFWTAVRFWRHITSNLSDLSSKRDCSPNRRDKRGCFQLYHTSPEQGYPLLHKLVLVRAVLSAAVRQGARVPSTIASALRRCWCGCGCSWCCC